MDHQAAMSEQLTDRQIVNLCRRGAEAGYRALVSVHHDYVFGLCWRVLGSREEALDVTQEVFIRAVRSMDRLDPRPSLRPWLRRVAVNLSINTQSRASWQAGRHRSVPLELAEGEANSGGQSSWEDPVARLAELRDDLGTVRRLLDQLSPEQRAVLVLHAGEGLAYPDIATLLGMPLGTVKSHASRARSFLRRSLRRAGEDLGL